jgi:hypothetical protein
VPFTARLARHDALHDEQHGCAAPHDRRIVLAASCVADSASCRSARRAMRCGAAPSHGDGGVLCRKCGLARSP